MSVYVSKNQNLGLSFSLKMEEDWQMVRMKQGIVSILSSNSAESTNAPSLRRNFSAELLAQHGFFFPGRKISCFEELSDSAAANANGEEEEDPVGEEEEDPVGEEEEDPVRQERKKEPERIPGLDVWSAILTQKTREDLGDNIKPYVHPMVKRSKSSLSEKSLKICTESLGSETGSDGFSSEGGDIEEDKEENSVQGHQEKQEEEIDLAPKVYMYGCLPIKKPPQMSFPPPIPSISRPNGGASTFMRTRRDNGRLVLEAVSVPSEKNFHVQRQNGRLVLTFASQNNDRESNENDGKNLEEMGEQLEVSEDENEGDNYDDETQEEEEEDDENEEGDDDDVEEEEQEEEEEEQGEEMRKMESFAVDQKPKPSSGLMSVHRLALMLNKPINVVNKNPNSFNEKVVGEMGDSFRHLGAQLLPPRPPGPARPVPSSRAPTALAASSATLSNRYEYYWRPKSSPRALAIYPDTKDKLRVRENQMVNHENGGNEVGHWLEGCKEQRRFLLLCQPQCIAIN